MKTGWFDRLICKRGLAALVCAGVLATSVPAFSQVTADDLARRHFESGAAYLHTDDYENALREFETAYELSKRAAILINVATVHERTGNLDSAIAALEQYLAEEPDGEHADTVRLRLENLKKRRAKLGGDAGAAAAPEADAGAERTPGAGTLAAADASAPEGAADAPPGPPPPPPEPESEGNIPAYILLGIGGVSAAASAVTGFMADREWHSKQDSCSPNCTDDELSTGRTMAVTSTILTGVALVGLGVGAALLLLDAGEQPPATAAGATPEVHVGFGPAGAAADATWRF